MTNKEKEKLIRELTKKIADVFEKEIPEDVLKTTGATNIMYCTALHLFCNMAFMLKLKPKELKNHIDIAFGDSEFQDIIPKKSLN